MRLNDALPLVTRQIAPVASLASAVIWMVGLYFVALAGVISDHGLTRADLEKPLWGRLPRMRVDHRFQEKESGFDA